MLEDLMLGLSVLYNLPSFLRRKLAHITVELLLLDLMLLGLMLAQPPLYVGEVVALVAPVHDLLDVVGGVETLLVALQPHGLVRDVVALGALELVTPKSLNKFSRNKNSTSSWVLLK